MNTVAALLGPIQDAIVIKSREETTHDEKHALVLYHYLLYKTRGEAQQLADVHAALAEIIAGVLRHDEPAPNVLCFPLIADLLAENLLSSSLHQQIVLLDHHLFGKAAGLLRTNGAGFFRGALGIIHYFAERLPSPRIAGYLRTLLPAALEAFGHHPNRGPVSLTLPDGLTGVLLVLMKCYEKGLADEQIKKFVRSAMLRIIACRLDVDFSARQYSVFPDVIGPGGADGGYTNALCWHNGDLNKCLLFYQANRLFDDADLLKIGNLVGLNTLLRKSPATTGVDQAHFSRGAAGLAQTYRFLFDTTGNASYQAGYAYWISQTKALLEAELAAGHYRHRELDVLDGLLGIALTLLASESPRPVRWSQCLLL